MEQAILYMYLQINGLQNRAFQGSKENRDFKRKLWLKLQVGGYTTRDSLRATEHVYPDADKSGLKSSEGQSRDFRKKSLHILREIS